MGKGDHGVRIADAAENGSRECGYVEYGLVGCGRQSDLSHMNGIVTRFAQPLIHHRRQGVVHKELHADTSRGNSRSRTASAA